MQQQHAFPEPLARGCSNFSSEQQLPATQLLKSPARAFFQEWLKKPILCPKGQRPIGFGSEEKTASAHRRVRFDLALGVLWEYSHGDSRKGDPLNFKVGNRFYALQQQLIATEGRPTAALQQEAVDAYYASKPSKKPDSPQIKAELERIFGPLQNPNAVHIPWAPISAKRINLEELFPEPQSTEESRQKHKIWLEKNKHLLA